MAAPTPISALVHSSTLVTAGLYLFIRFSYVFYAHPSLIKVLMVLRLLTRFYAGAIAPFEVDYKKLIALSTLSHLGFILLAFSAGLLEIAFFHLVVHALFKSLLFLAYGGIMGVEDHSQDGRYMRGNFQTSPIRSFLMRVSLFNLVGIPRLRGFFSKDFVLEAFSYSNTGSFLVLGLYVNVFFTYMYSFKLFTLNLNSNLRPYKVVKEFKLLPLVSLVHLATLRIIFGVMKVTLRSLIIEYVALVPEVKLFPFTLSFLMFVLINVLFKLSPTFKRTFSHVFFLKMMFLRVIQKYSNPL